ncbi:MAG TPA: prepilin-type N-terminal cleavage/methylation domain-containing protein [Verrucomicrobiae bacterium]
MKTNTERAFTLVELLVVVALVALLGLTLVPARAGARGRGQAINCAANLGQLVRAWQFYAADNNGRLVMNFQGGYIPGVGSSDAPWATGWLDWSTSTENTNTVYLLNDRYAKLTKYMEAEAARFQCPSDRFVSQVQRARGWVNRCRSYSMSACVGGGNVQDGAWFPLYKQVTRMSEFAWPIPAETWVFAEEHPDSLNDPGLFSPYATRFVDVPASHHEGGGGFAFADGHYELHRWRGTLASNQVARIVSYANLNNLSAPAGDPDLHWVSYHSSRSSTNSY